MKPNFSFSALASLMLQRAFNGGRHCMAANEAPPPVDPGFEAARTGAIYAANDGELESARRAGNVFDAQAANDGNLSATPLGLSRPLSEYITGVQDREGLQALLDRIAPVTPVGGIRFSYNGATEAEEFQKRTLGGITRPVHGDFPVLQVTGTESEGRCANLGLVSYIDIDQGGLLPAMQQNEVQRLRNIILRSQIADALALIDAAATADSAANWNATGADPDSDIDDMIDAGGDASGIDNNVVVFGGGAFMKRRRAYRKEARTNGGELSRLTPEELRDVYNVDDVINLRARYRSSSSATTKLLANTVYTYDARPGLSAMDSSNVKRFNYVTDMGGMRVWIQPQTHRVKIIVDAYAVTKITRTTGIRKRAITFT